MRNRPDSNSSSGDPKFHGNIQLNAHTNLKPVIMNYSTSLEFYKTDFYGEINSIILQFLFDRA